MPTYDEIPVRHPVLEHAEARMRLRPSPLQRAGTGEDDAGSASAGASALWTVVAGVAGGLTVLGLGTVALRVLV